MTSKTEQVKQLNRALEGGVFYPTGYLVAGLPRREDAERVQRGLSEAGYDEEDCILVPPEVMLRAATAELEHNSLISLLGSSVQVRQQQVKLAEEGCTFLLIYAPSEPEKVRLLRVLTRVPVRYLIHYHRFTIEDLIENLPSAQPDARQARTSREPGE
jgi:hypothetical protein